MCEYLQVNIDDGFLNLMTTDGGITKGAAFPSWRDVVSS